MASNIQWTEETWNPIVGCSVVSPGCTNCYAMREAGGRLKSTPKYEGLTKPSKAGAVWNGRVRLWDKALLAPLDWKKPRTIFVNSMGDLFHENVPDEWIDQVFAVMALTPRHIYQILTKRSGRMRRYIRGLSRFNHRMNRFERHSEAMTGREYGAGLSRDWPLPNVWLGVSAEDQERANERIPDLLETPAAVRFISAEPLLGHIEFDWIDVEHDHGVDRLDALSGVYDEQNGGRLYRRACPSLDWIIVGGESGPNARYLDGRREDTDLDFIRSMTGRAAENDVPVFVKQLGSVWAKETGAKHKKGGDPAEWPEELRVREFPKGSE